MFSLKPPHRGDSNEYTQYTLFNIKKKHTGQLLPKIYTCGIFSYGLKNDFETAVVSEPSLSEPVKFYYMGMTVFLII